MHQERLEAVIFDCDGVLVDSEPTHDESTRQELAARGVQLDDSFFVDHIGMRVIDQMASLSGRHGIDAAELYTAREQRFWALIEQGFAEVPGSRAAVRAVHDAGLRVAVATSGTRRWTDYVVDRLDIGAFVDASISGEDVERPKPDPQPYQVAAEALSTPTRLCGVVEDSRRGYLSAVAAGCRVVVLDREQRPAALFPDAVAVTASMAEAAKALLRDRL